MDADSKAMLTNTNKLFYVVPLTLQMFHSTQQIMSHIVVEQKPRTNRARHNTHNLATGNDFIERGKIRALRLSPMLF